MADCKEKVEDIDHPSLVLKVDPPEELLEDSTEGLTTNNLVAPADRDMHIYDDTNSHTLESNDQESTLAAVKLPNKKHSSILAVSKLGNSFGIEFSNSVSSKSKSSILRPSQLSVLSNNSTGTTDKTILQPAKFHNPFAKAGENSIEEDEPITKSNKTETDKDIKCEQKQTEDVKLKFLPLGVSTKENENNVNNTVASSTSNLSFVFGQNLKERVTVSNDTESLTNSEKDETKSEESTENGSSELLFSNAAASCRTTARPGLTLTQAAQVLEEANRANKRKYNQVTLLTGEEGETNILQINCKLFAFDKISSSWQERGRGTLRLNDRDDESRLVGRTSGTQRLILNTKIWPGMTAERAGPKSLRLTALDVLDGDIRVFIVQAAPKEIDQLHSLVLQRLKRAQERHPKKLAMDH